MADASSEIQKNDIIEAEIDSLGYRGEGVARVNRVPVFINGGLVGEKVRALIILVKKDYAVGKLQEVKEPSPERVTPPCRFFGKCGGCNVMQMTYAAQLEFKRGLVRDAFRKIAGQVVTVEECEGSSKQFGYRNKLSLPVREVNGESKVGMFAYNSHRIVEIDDCLLQTDGIRAIIPKLSALSRHYRAYNEESGKGVLRHFALRDINGKPILTVVATRDIRKGLIENIEACGIDVEEVWLNINTSRNNVIMGDTTYKVKGASNTTEELHGVDVEVHPRSFVQVNEDIANKLYAEVKRELSREKQKRIIDAYSGGGTMTAMLSGLCEEIIGVEIEKTATDAANRLVKRMGLTNVRNINGDCAKVLPDLVRDGRGTTVILDPPRSGCDAEVTAAVNDSGAERVIYISCNPSTLARDVKALSNYTVKRIKPYDMFPQTCHVETLVLLCRK